MGVLIRLSHLPNTALLCILDDLVSAAFKMGSKSRQRITAIILSLCLGAGGLPASDIAWPQNRLISIQVEDVEISTLLSEIAEMHGLNLIIPKELSDRVTLRLRNVTWEVVFDVVLETTGYGFILDGNILHVKTVEQLLAAPLRTEVFVLNYADSEALGNIVASLIDPASGERVTVNRRMNALVVTARPRKLHP